MDLKIIEQKHYVEKTTAKFWNTKKMDFFNSKIQSICYTNMILKFALIPFVGKTSFASHTKHAAEATQGSIHSWEKTYSLEF